VEDVRGTTAVVLLPGPAVLFSAGARAKVVLGAELSDVVDPELLDATCLLLPQAAATRAQSRARATPTHRYAVIECLDVRRGPIVPSSHWSGRDRIRPAKLGRQTGASNPGYWRATSSKSV
jgi:hypothetical protein